MKLPSIGFQVGQNGVYHFSSNSWALSQPSSSFWVTYNDFQHLMAYNTYITYKIDVWCNSYSGVQSLLPTSLPRLEHTSFVPPKKGHHFFPTDLIFVKIVPFNLWFWVQDKLWIRWVCGITDLEMSHHFSRSWACHDPNAARSLEVWKARFFFSIRILDYYNVLQLQEHLQKSRASYIYRYLIFGMYICIYSFAFCAMAKNI